MDEYGEMRDPIQHEDGTWQPSKVFGYGASVVDKPEPFGKISSKIRATKHDNPMKELKAKRMSQIDKENMAKDIVDAGAKTYHFYYDKEEHPERNRAGYVTFLRMAIRAADIILSQIDDEEVLFVLDQHSAYEVEKRERIPETSMEYLSREFENLSKKYHKDVKFVIGDSRKGDWKDEIQTNDLVPHSMKMVIELDDDSIDRILDTRRFKI